MVLADGNEINVKIEPSFLTFSCPEVAWKIKAEMVKFKTDIQSGAEASHTPGVSKGSFIILK